MKPFTTDTFDELAALLRMVLVPTGGPTREVDEVRSNVERFIEFARLGNTSLVDTAEAAKAASALAWEAGRRRGMSGIMTFPEATFDEWWAGPAAEHIARAIAGCTILHAENPHTAELAAENRRLREALAVCTDPQLPLGYSQEDLRDGRIDALQRSGPAPMRRPPPTPREQAIATYQLAQADAVGRCWCGHSPIEHGRLTTNGGGRCTAAACTCPEFSARPR